MSHMGKNENLLIDFNNLNVDNQSGENDRLDRSTTVESMLLCENIAAAKPAPESMAFLCSSQPLYKLLSSETNDMQGSNPFDHFDKQACLSDDPFEIVENAALILSDAQSHNENIQVETGTLISLDSPINSAGDGKNAIYSKTICDTPKSSNDTRNGTQSQDSVQNASQKAILSSKIVSPISPSTGKSRSKTKSTSLSLLKYSLSNSRTDLTTENGSLSEDNVSGDEGQQKNPKPTTLKRRDSGKDDSFDDIWETKPNLIDSQTDIDADNDIDNDIAKLNIPMLNATKSDSKTDECTNLKRNEHEFDESIETKALHRNELREKLASFKQKFPPSPAAIDVTTILPPIHNQTVDISIGRIQSHENAEEEPVTPKSQYSSVVLQQPTSLSENSNSLFENLKKLVDQCNDESKQTMAKHLLDDLSSLLTNHGKKPTKRTEKRSPQPIKRQGTFSIEKDTSDDVEKRFATVDCTEEITKTDPGLSQVVKQIQNVLGTHQNINVLQTNIPTADNSVPTVNPTYIVVMAQPATDFSAEELPKPHRNRSQSLTLKDRPLAPSRAIQQKVEQSRIQSTPVPTPPVKRPTLQRRSSFGALTRPTPNNEKELQNKPMHIVDKPNPPKLIRRRSIQGPLLKSDEPEPMQAKPMNPVTRRRSFQAPPTTSKIRSPSPKTDLNSGRGPTSQLRLASNLTRRKSLASDLTKESPQKMKTSYGIMKKPSAPPAAKNFKIRVSQAVQAGGRSAAPMRAVVPMNRVASMLLINETVSSVDGIKSNSLITSTPRSSSSMSPAKNKNGNTLTVMKFSIQFAY